MEINAESRKFARGRGCFTKSIGFYFDALQDVVGSYADGSGTPAMKVTGVLDFDVDSFE